MGRPIHWTGLLDWTTGLTFLPLLCPVIRLTTSRVASYGTLACKTPSLLLLNDYRPCQVDGADMYREIPCN